MDQRKIENITAKATGYLDSGRLRDAFATLRALAEEGMQWEVSDEINRIEKSYAYMLSYLTDGSADPERDRIYASLVADTHRVIDMLHRRLMLADCPTLYFNTLRTLRMRPTSLGALMGEYMTASGASANLVEQLAAGQAPAAANPRELERIERTIFNYLWTAGALTETDAETLRAALADEILPARLKQLMVSGIALGILEYMDDRRMTLLMDIYDTDSDINRSSAALTALLLALFKYRRRALSSTVVNRLKALADSDKWQNDLKTAFLELIRTRDTERINRTMREDIIPGMMKMRPDIMRKMNEGAIDPENLEANPEWEEMLEKSGLAARIRDLSELQQEGADVFMATFSHLKTFPFFNEIANWFLPFDTKHSDVAGIDIPEPLLTLTASIPFLCDSDKYSFLLSIGAVPESQRKLMMSQFESQKGAQLEAMMQGGTILPQAQRRAAISTFLQNLYRFLNLFRRKGEFYNPFNEGINLLSTNSLADYFNDIETVRVVAEFYFRLGYWADALTAFTRLDAISEPQAIIFQKLGYCNEKLGNLDAAIDQYHQAELFEPDGKWLMRRLAAAYRAKGNYRQSAEYYKRLAAANPDNADIALSLGYVLIQAGDNREALSQFFKAEFLDEKGTRALRPLAWTLFITGDLQRSMDYYRRVLADNPTATDYLNMGHVAAALTNYKEAINFYKLSLNSGKQDSEALIKAIRADAPHLNRAGVNDNTIALLIDALLYSL